MNKLIYLTTVLLCIHTVALAADRQIKVEYDNGYEYRLKLIGNSLTWKGLKGPDMGKEETSSYEAINIDSQIELLKWVESDGTFVNVILNGRNETAISSGTSAGKDWVYKGSFHELNSEGLQCRDSNYKFNFNINTVGQGELKTKIRQEWKWLGDVLCFRKQGDYPSNMALDWVANCQVDGKDRHSIHVLREKSNESIKAKVFRDWGPKYQELLGTLDCS